MGKVFDVINADVAAFIEKQHMFFVASAPSGDSGHVNVSPKGLDSFRILDERTVAYLDFTGSGVETIAHLRQNGRIVLMFCAFEGSPHIVRLHGKGESVEPEDPRFAVLRERFAGAADASGLRAVVVVHVARASTSCGYSVPKYSYEGERDQLSRWAEKKSPDGIAEYQSKHNATSLDGLPGLRRLTEDPQGE
jgi:hypothetical protein